MGDLSKSTSSMSCRMRSSMSRIDMWHPKQPARDAVATLGFAMAGYLSVIGRGGRPPGLDVGPDRLDVVEPLADGHRVAHALPEDRADRADVHGLVGAAQIRIRQVRLGVHPDLLVRAPPHELEGVLPVQVARGPDAAGAEDAAVAVDEDVGMAGVDVAVRELVRVARGQDAEAVGQGLQLAVAALLAEHAVVVPLHEQHLDEAAAVLLEGLGLVVHHHALGRGRGAGRLRAAVDHHRADPAGAEGRQVLVGAQARDVHAGLVGGLEDRLARLAFDLDPVDGEEEALAHGAHPLLSPRRVRMSVPPAARNPAGPPGCRRRPGTARRSSSAAGPHRRGGTPGGW